MSTRPKGNIRKVSADIGSITTGTLTGTVVRTAASGARIELTSTDGFRAIDSGGNVRVQIPVTGDAIEVTVSATVPGRIKFGTASEIFHDNSYMHLGPQVDKVGDLRIGSAEVTKRWRHISMYSAHDTSSTIHIKALATTTLDGAYVELNETHALLTHTTDNWVSNHTKVKARQNFIDLEINGNVHGQLDQTIADTETALLLRRNVGGAYSLQRVSMGAIDSGGVGFKVLRVPN